MTKGILKTAAALAAALVFAAAASAQVYKCRAASGRVAYSDAPCAGSAQQEDVQLQGNVIETSMDARRTRRSLRQLENEAAAAEQQRLRQEQERAAAPKAARAAQAAPEEPALHGSPEHQRRLRAQQRRIKAQQRAQQQRATPRSQR